MNETRRNGNGDLLGPKVYDPRSYDERQIDRAVPDDMVDMPDTVDGRVEVFLNRWHWRGDRDVVRKELIELIERAQ